MIPARAADTRAAKVFAGRAVELGRMRAALIDAAAGAPRVVALVGMPGAGKSYLAERFAADHADRFPGGVRRILLADAPPRSAVDWLQAIVPDARSSDAEVAAVFEATGVLVQIDNADSYPLAAIAAGLVRRLPGVACIVTGRQRDIGTTQGWDVIAIEPFARTEDAESLLAQELAGVERAPTGPALRRLIDEIGGLPLALHLAAGALRRGREVSWYLRRLLDERKRDPAATDAHSMDARLRVSLEMFAGEAGAHAARWRAALLRLGLGPLDGFGLSLASVIADLDEDETGDLLDLARSLSLVGVVPAQERTAYAVRCHTLIAAWLRREHQSVDPDRADRASIDARIATWIFEHAQEDPVDDRRARWEALHDEMAGLARWMTEAPIANVGAILRAGPLFATAVGPTAGWLAAASRVITDATVDYEARSWALWVAIECAQRAGELDRALGWARMSRQLEQSAGNEHRATLIAGKIADILQDRGDLDEALRIHREDELPVHEQLGDVQSRAVTLGKIADILQARGDLDEALRIRREDALPVYEQLGDVRSRAITLGRIADILQARGDLDEALRIRREDTLPVYEQLGDVRSRAITLGKIADILQDRGDLDEALRICREDELPVYEQLGDVRSRAITLGHIADILQIRGDLDEALRIRREEQLPVLEARRLRPDVCTAQWKLARLLLQRGNTSDRAEAHRLLRAARDTARLLKLSKLAAIEDDCARHGVD